MHCHVKIPSPKKLEDHVTHGYFMGFTKSKLLIHWLDPSSHQVKHAYAIQLNEHCTPTSINDHTLQITFPPKGHLLGCTIMTCTYYDLPYICQLTKGSPMATHLAHQGPHNTTFWLLSINHKEFSTAESLQSNPLPVLLLSRLYWHVINLRTAPPWQSTEPSSRSPSRPTFYPYRSFPYPLALLPHNT